MGVYEKFFQYHRIDQSILLAKFAHFFCMSIKRKVKAVERVFKSLDEEINRLKAKTGLHCLTGCGMCCTKPDIEASPLEFLPLAFEWFQNGQAMEKLEFLQQNYSPICVSYAPLSLIDQTSGSCGTYLNRGLICRLFGYGATRDKNGELKLVTCKLIKEDQPGGYATAHQLIHQKEYIPVFSDYYKKLFQIDFKLANQVYPINKAIQVALEEILHYYAYRPFSPIKKTG